MPLGSASKEARGNGGAAAFPRRAATAAKEPFRGLQSPVRLKQRPLRETEAQAGGTAVRSFMSTWSRAVSRAKLSNLEEHRTLDVRGREGTELVWVCCRNVRFTKEAQAQWSRLTELPLPCSAGRAAGAESRQRNRSGQGPVHWHRPHTHGVPVMVREGQRTMVEGIQVHRTPCTSQPLRFWTSRPPHLCRRPAGSKRLRRRPGYGGEKASLRASCPVGNAFATCCNEAHNTSAATGDASKISAFQLLLVCSRSHLMCLKWMEKNNGMLKCGCTHIEPGAAVRQAEAGGSAHSKHVARSYNSCESISTPCT